MQKQIKRRTKSFMFEIKLPGEVIMTGPGTVPTSSASVSETSMKDVISLSRQASKEGVFKAKEKQEYGIFPNASR